MALNELRAPVDGRTMSLGEIIEDCDLVPRVEQFLDANGTDVACAARDKNFHPREICGATTNAQLNLISLELKLLAGPIGPAQQNHLRSQNSNCTVPRSSWTACGFIFSNGYCT